MRRALIGVLILGCGASATPPPTASVRGAAIAEWERECVAPAATNATPNAAPSVTLARHAAPSRYQTVRIQRPAVQQANRGRRIDVRLEHARLASAFRLLAEAADLGIVIGEGLESEISVDLRRVRPVEAMQALAQAYGIELSMIGRTVVARRVN